MPSRYYNPNHENHLKVFLDALRVKMLERNAKNEREIEQKSDRHMSPALSRSCEQQCDDSDGQVEASEAAVAEAALCVKPNPKWQAETISIFSQERLVEMLPFQPQ